jgi:hypothetical protein
LVIVVKGSPVLVFITREFTKLAHKIINKSKNPLG